MLQNLYDTITALLKPNEAAVEIQGEVVTIGFSGRSIMCDPDRDGIWCILYDKDGDMSDKEFVDTVGEAAMTVEGWVR